MSLKCIKIYIYELYTQRDFYRVQERTNQSSDKKVMVIQSRRLNMNSAYSE